MIVGNLRKMADSDQSCTSFQRKVKHVQKWKCDVCQIAVFSTLEEACAHEEQCKKERCEQKIAAHRMIPETGRRRMYTSTTANFRRPTSEIIVVQNPKPAIQSATKSDLITTYPNLKERQKNSKSSGRKEREALILPQGNQVPTKAMKPSRKAPTTNEILGSSLFISSNHGTIKRMKKRPHINVSDIDKTLPPIRRKLIQRTREKQSADTSGASLASIFGGKMMDGKKSADALLAEHRAAEFVMKQRIKAEKERKRQQKRQEARSQQQPKESIRAPKQAPKKESTYPLDLRFYSATHVNAPFSSCKVSDGDQTWVRNNHVLKAQSRLRTKVRHTLRPIVDACTEDYKILNPQLGKSSIESGIHQAANILASKLEFPVVKSIDGKLWTEKHSYKSIPADVVGECNQDISNQVLQFIDEWKIERQKVHTRRAEKQKSLKQMKKQKRTIECNEEDLWGESDDETGIICVCLLTGPPGSGKTSLVHAAARQSGCVVIEVNTSFKRGGQALKHAIEEATQSDSTLEMMKKKNSESFVELVDTDDDEDEGAGKRSAVPIVLIDEVDNLFVENGDAGFWTALKAVAKKAKCPVFLTANRAPEELRASSIRHFQLETALPQPSDCAQRLWRILEEEGFRNKNGYSEEDLQMELGIIAEIFQCDFRRILNFLQLLPSPSQQMTIGAENIVSKLTISPSTFSLEITDVSPKQVNPNKSTVIMIKGRGFISMLGQKIIVCIGGNRPSMSQVQNDTTIFAVCPPCTFPDSVNKYGFYEQTLRECLECRFATVTVGFDSLGVSSSTIGTSGVAWTIEYTFPVPPPSMSTGLDSDSMNDFNENETWMCSDESSPTSWLPAEKIEAGVVTQQILTIGDMPKLATELIGNALATFKGLNFGDLKSSQTQDIVRYPLKADSYYGLEFDSRFAALGSDLAFLQDHLDGVPCLSGASRGFGQELIDGGCLCNSIPIEKRMTRIAKPPCIERMMASGWNDEYCFFGNSDTFLTAPLSARDRGLLRAAVSEERGISVSHSDGLSSSAVCITDDLDSGTVDSSASGIAVADEKCIAVSDEDMLLSCKTPICFIDLHNVISELSSRNRSFYNISDELLPMRKNAKLATKTKLLAQIFSEDSHLASFGRGVTRVVDSLLSDDKLDENMILDYFPFLAKIAGYDQVAESALELQTSEEQSTGRRATRRTKWAQHDYYFFGLNLTFREDTEIVQTLVSKLANNLLQIA